MKSLKKYMPFIISFIIIALLWYGTIYLTKNAPHTDGIARFGFPLTYHKWGGMCFKGCGDFFSYPLLSFDIAFLIIFPFIVQLIVQKIKTICAKKKVNKK